MGSHPLNLALRFLLEITVLILTGTWGWNLLQGPVSWIMAIAIPAFLAVIWGVFNVPNDPSRSGKAPIVVPGAVRLILEIGFFAFGTWAIWDLDLQIFSIIFGAIVITHYAFSYDRIIWLLRN